MRQWKARIVLRARCERGFTLIELLIAMSLSLLIAGATMTFMIVSFDQGNAVSSRATASRQAEAGLEQLVRDIRDAMATDASGAALLVTCPGAAAQPAVCVSSTATTTTINLNIPTPGADTTAMPVIWICPSTGAATQGFCTRNGRHEISGVISAAFAPTSSTGTALTLPASNPAYIGITLNAQVTSASDAGQTHVVRGVTNPIKIQTGADLRNFQ